MAISVKTYKCPSCGANVDVKDNEKEGYCSYCGSKIKVQNDNEIIINHVDEAEIKRIEAEKEIKMHQYESFEKSKNEIKSTRKVMLVIGIITILISAALLSIGYTKLEDGGIPFLIFGLLLLYGGFFIIFERDNVERKEREEREERANIQRGMIRFNFEETNLKYKTLDEVKSSLKRMGFKNIKEINLHDLKFGILIPHGTVRSVTINGSEPIHDYWYEPDAEVIIKFSGTK